MAVIRPSLNRSIHYFIIVNMFVIEIEIKSPVSENCNYVDIGREGQADRLVSKPPRV